MGFIGAGAIIRERGAVLGLTTAATLWVVAGIGVFVGTGWFAPAIGLTAVTVGTLLILGMVERVTVRAHRPIPPE